MDDETAGGVTCGEKTSACRLKERDHLEDLWADGRIILKYSLGRWEGRALTGFIRLRKWTGGAGCC